MTSSNPSSEQLFAVDVLEDQPLMGLAARVADLEGLSDDDAAAQLRAEAERDDVARDAARGPMDVLAKTISRIRGRTLLGTVGGVKSVFDVLTLHVPPGGTAALEIGREDERATHLTV